MNNFRSIKWKLALLCCLCITAVLTVICAIQTGTMIYGEKQSFETAVKSVFSDELVGELCGIAEEVDYTVNNDGADMTVNAVEMDNAKRLYDRIWTYAGELGINSSRFMCILDSSGTPLYSTSEKIIDDGVVKTPSIIAALNGNAGMSTSLIQKHMDYAVALGTSKYIVYINDTGDMLYANVRRSLLLYVICLIGGIILSMIAGLYTANSVTIPLKHLNRWAKQLAEGELDAKTDVAGHDELSELSEALVNMANKLDLAITEAKNDQTKLETILQSMTDGLLAFNTKGELIHYNNEAKRLLSRNYLDDIEFDKFFKEINVDITIGDLLYMKPDGDVERKVALDKEKYILMSFKTFELDGKVAGIVVVLHDTTRQERLENSRRAFVADVSHELRTPITTIKSYSETLLDSPAAEGEFAARFIGVIASEADRMARLISDLLTLSSLDDKHSSYKIPEKVDVRKIVTAVTERMQINASKKNQKLTYSPINDAPIIMGDPDALERVVINIVTNAVKYTQDGGTIDVYTSKVYNDICIKVTDNGIGIPEENLPNIFDRFYRVDKARSRETGGTGLGLAIAKQTVENIFGGKIKIVSEVGKGTEVSITIPVPA